MSTEQDLMSCPFCGGTAQFVERYDNSSSFVQCDSMIDDHSACKARGPIGIQDDDGEETPGEAAAIRAWNDRALQIKTYSPPCVGHSMPLSVDQLSAYQSFDRATILNNRPVRYAGGTSGLDEFMPPGALAPRVPNGAHPLYPDLVGVVPPSPKGSDRVAVKTQFGEMTPQQLARQQAVPLRYTSDGALAECPCCGSLDVGGAHDTVNCYGCGLTITKPSPLQNACDAWNARIVRQPAPQAEQKGRWELAGVPDDISGDFEGRCWIDTATNQRHWLPLDLDPNVTEPGAQNGGPTVCDTCHGQGEVWTGKMQRFGEMSMQPPEPIMEECPECGGEEPQAEQVVEQKPAGWVVGRMLDKLGKGKVSGISILDEPTGGHDTPLFRAPPTPDVSVLAFQTAKDGLHWPRVGEKYLVSIKGVFQEDAYEFDQGDDGVGGGEYFWSRDDVDECPAFDSDRDKWIALTDIAALATHKQEGK